MKLKFHFLPYGSSQPSLRNLINSVYVSAVLIAMLPKIVAGKEAIGPLDLINGVLPTAKDIEQFTQLQMMLENFAEESNLYYVTETERNAILRKLYKDPEVQKVIKKCEEFHVQPSCDYSPYRRIDGTCNNLKHPKWGSAIIETDRFLPASYDGVRKFRKSINGEDLPPPRKMNLKLGNKKILSRSISALFTFFGQIVTHDITMTPAIAINGSVPNCCHPSKENELACVPLQIPDEDPFYSQFNITCLNFVRAVPYPKCNFERRSSVNKQTSFLDASMTYGLNDEVAQSIRANDGSGRLKSQDSTVGELMPKNRNENKLFCPINAAEICFEGGDDRVNQHTMLVILHTLYQRLHNKFADSFHGINPHWDDEKIYQEARRLVIALHQYIVYKEYLPNLVGPSNMNKYDLKVNFKERSLYDDTLKPTILSEFNTAAFRVHSMVPSEISKNHPELNFAKLYSNFDPIYDGHLASMLSGSSEVASRKNDRFAAPDVTHFLYSPPGSTYGSDLVSVDIQRGRDLGLPSYVEVVKKCSGEKIIIQDFSDLSKTMTEENIEVLRSIYTDVMDVDLWTGIALETHVEKSVNGFTAACISSIQFRQLKFGDRFYFTHINGTYPFTNEQLKSIKAYSLAKMLCGTTNMTEVRRRPFLLPSKKNPLVSCQSLSQMNLMPWKE